MGTVYDARFKQTDAVAETAASGMGPSPEYRALALSRRRAEPTRGELLSAIGARRIPIEQESRIPRGDC
jgi:hypothetical protein